MGSTIWQCQGCKAVKYCKSGARNHIGQSTKSCVVLSRIYQRLKRTVILAIS